MSENNLIGQQREDDRQHKVIAWPQSFIQDLELPAAYQCDLQGHVIHYNKAAVEIWGKTPLVGRDLWGASLQMKDTEGNVVRSDANPMIAAIQQLTAQQPKELELLRLDGATRYVLAHAAPTFNQEGEVSGATNVMIDISRYIQKADSGLKDKHALEELEIKVKKRTAQLEDANKELEAFNYTVSHDLQAPLRTISGFSRILLNEYRDKLGNEAKEHLEFIEKSVRQMNSLIKSLLSFSKLGKAPLNCVDVDFNELVRRIVEELKSGSDSRVEMIIHDLPPTEGDADLIRQVWVNLIGNAVKYSSKKSYPLVEIGATENRGELVYYIRDNGTGFKMEEADKLFAPFQRIHSSDEFEGTGVGLATVHRIITKHGGRIWADAREDEGATFYFTLKKNCSKE